MKSRRTIHVEADESVWRLFDEYRVHLGKLTNSIDGPPPEKVAGAIISYFFLSIGDALFQTAPEVSKEELLEKYKPYLPKLATGTQRKNTATPRAPQGIAPRTPNIPEARPTVPIGGKRPSKT